MNSATAHTRASHHQRRDEATTQGTLSRAINKICFQNQNPIAEEKEWTEKRQESGAKMAGSKLDVNGGKKRGPIISIDQIMTTKLEVMKAARLHRMGGQAVVLVSEKGRRWRSRTARQPELERGLRELRQRGGRRDSIADHPSSVVGVARNANSNSHQKPPVGAEVAGG